MSLKVLMVASEAAPFAKSGGLGDVVGSLPKALQAEGVEVRVVFPKYRTIKDEFLKRSEYISSFEVTLEWRKQKADIYKMRNDVPTYMIGNDFYFGRGGYYGYGDDNERFAFFCKAAIEFLTYIDFIPDIIHCNDWQTGPICVYMKDIYSKLACFKKVKTLFTVHNLQYQGLFPRDTLNMMELNDGYFVDDKLEYYNMVSYMKAGLTYADGISTVSRTYADEIQTAQYGYGLDGLLSARHNSLTGIVNGIDYEQDNPATSSKIFANFDANNLAGKLENKRKLQEELRLPVRDDVPMIGVISRLVDQKGINLIIKAAQELMARDIQLVVVGTGDVHYENILRDIGYRHSDKASINILFSDELAQKVYAASDMFLMPSLFEPCGLGQLFAMSYGTVPIARTTGGLVDTVECYNSATGKGNGFLFKDYDYGGLLWAIDEALGVYHDKENWNKVVQNAFATNFSWANSAKEYIKVYQNL